MSWITNLAGRAELLLEQVDGAAATALKTKEGQTNPGSGNSSEAEPTYSKALSGSQGNIPRVSSESSIQGGPSQPIKARAPLTVPRPQPKPARREQKNDDQLFEFLNSSAPPSKERRPNKAKLTDDATDAVTRQTSNTVQVKDRVDHPTGATEDRVRKEESQTKREVAPPSSQVEEPVSQGMAHDVVPAAQLHNQASSQLSNLELENTLLRKEVASLNEEMVAVVQRAKEAEKRLHEAERQVQKTQQQLSASETVTRQLRSQESDYNEALSAKDSQLAVLRVRIQESDQEILNKKEQLKELQLQREKLLKDHTDSSGIQGHALATLKAKLEDTEKSLHQEQENHQRTQQEAMDQQTKLQEQQQSMAESLKNLQKKLNEERNRSSEHLAAVKTAKVNLEAARQELKDYKDKAGRILQAKDKVISTLREGGSAEEVSGVTSTEYEEACRERDMLRDELNQLKYRVEQLKADLQDLEQQQQSEAELAQENIRELEGSLEQEKSKREACEQEIQQHVQDLKYSQEEVQRSKASVMTQLQEREAEIQKLRNQLATKALTSTSEQELENRVRALTENLIQKQTLIEALSTEKNSLVLQLERLEQQYRDVQASTARLVSGPTPVALDGFDADSDENTLSRVKSITSIMPHKLNESQNVKKAVNEIDKFSIRLGLFLRRYPIARLFVILYMVLLHLWVLVVLLTYKPEMHDSDTPGLPRPLGT